MSGVVNVRKCPEVLGVVVGVFGVGEPDYSGHLSEDVRRLACYETYIAVIRTRMLQIDMLAGSRVEIRRMLTNGHAFIEETPSYRIVIQLNNSDFMLSKRSHTSPPVVPHVGIYEAVNT